MIRTWNMKEEYEALGIFFTNIYMSWRATSGSAEWQKFGMIGQLWLVFSETTSAEGVAGTRWDGDGLRLDSAASPLGARRGSGDAPFHSQTADIANPFQNISFLNASSSRWITNLSITSLSRPTFQVAEATNTTRRLLPSNLSRRFRRRISFQGKFQLVGNVATVVVDNIGNFARWPCKLHAWIVRNILPTNIIFLLPMRWTILQNQDNTSLRHFLLFFFFF